MRVEEKSGRTQREFASKCISMLFSLQVEAKMCKRQLGAEWMTGISGTSVLKQATKNTTLSIHELLVSNEVGLVYHCGHDLIQRER